MIYNKYEQSVCVCVFTFFYIFYGYYTLVYGYTSSECIIFKFIL